MKRKIGTFKKRTLLQKETVVFYCTGLTMIIVGGLLSYFELWLPIFPIVIGPFFLWEYSQLLDLLNLNTDNRIRAIAYRVRKYAIVGLVALTILSISIFRYNGLSIIGIISVDAGLILITGALIIDENVKNTIIQ